MDLSQNCDHSIILKGHINTGYGLNAHSTTPGHASGKPTDCPKIDILPNFNPRGIILALGARGPRFKSRTSPAIFALNANAIEWNKYYDEQDI